MVSLPFDELFAAIEANSVAALHAVILQLKQQSQYDSEVVYNLLNRGHPQKKLNALQFALLQYSHYSLRIISILLEYGAGTELPIDFTEYVDSAENEFADYEFTPLWIAVRKKYPKELVEFLLDFKADVFSRRNGFTLLHEAIKVGAEGIIVRMLIEASKSLLLNDQDNTTRSTPLILAVEQNRFELAEMLTREEGANLQLKNSEGLTAYDIAAQKHSLDLCLLLASAVDVDDDSSETSQYHLEVMELTGPSTWHSHTNLRKSLRVFRDLDEAGDELLPIKGYWEWIDPAWMIQKGVWFCRLRRLIALSESEQFYLKQAIDLVQRDDHPTALKILLEGLQKEVDGEKKRRAAWYFQRLLQRSGTPTLGLLDNLSRSNLAVFSSEDHRINRPLGMSDEEESDDSLLYCPVCSHRFEREDKKTWHLKSCLKTPASKQHMIGSRYTRITGRAELEGECPICYEELRGGRSGSGAVVMDCLCKFHEACIEKWLQRGKTCPYHHE